VLVVVLSAVFTASGLHALNRLSESVSGAAAGVDRMAELAHLLMSLAMLGMTWGWTGGPATAGGILQLAVFGLLSVWFLARVLRSEPGERIGSAYHLVMLLAMVWMVAAMPQIMGTGAAATAHDHHGSTGEGAAVGGVSAADSGMPSGTLMITLAVVAVLCAAAAVWAVRALRPASVAAPVPVAPGSPAAGDVAESGRQTEPTHHRLDAGMHLLSTLGMAGSLLAML
jgi:hypothetical protein